MERLEVAVAVACCQRAEVHLEPKKPSRLLGTWKSSDIVPHEEVTLLIDAM